MPRLNCRSFVNTSAQELFEWHARPGAFERLSPPWESVRIEEKCSSLEVGSRTSLKIATPCGWKRWIAEHVACEPGKSFEDVQIEGPFARWRHRHRFDPCGDGCELSDQIEYTLPAGWLGEALAGEWVNGKLARSFAYRHAITRGDLDLWKRTETKPRYRVLIAGGSGFLGSHLRSLLESQGHRVSTLTRRVRNDSDVKWDPAAGELDCDAIEGFDAVVNLCGEGVASGRWTAERKRRIWDSRVNATRLLVDRLSQCSVRPRVFVSGSGVGIYGEGGRDGFDESAPMGTGFLAELSGAWEAEAQRAESFGARVVILRTGLPLSGSGGALKLIAKAFKFGVGGRLGNGRQWFPWISLEDWLGATYELLLSDEANGAYNLASPQAVDNAEFTRRLAQYLGRPGFCHAPEWLLRSLLGEMAGETLLISQRVLPHRLIDEHGFTFRYPGLDDALKMAL